MYRLALLSLFIFSLSTQAFDVIIPSPPKLAASVYYLIDADTGTVIAESNSNKRIPPASLTKMMTSYVAAYEIGRGNFTLDDPVRVSEKANRTRGSRMFIEEGAMVRLEELLRGVIIQSGNDASIAVAEHIAGGEEIYVDLMNQHAKRMGLQDTQFANVTGLPHKDNYASAADLAKIGISLINEFPDHYRMYGEKFFTWGPTSNRQNRNALLWRDDTVDGIKTGHTEEAGFCLVASSKKDDMRLVSVVMGTSSEKARIKESQKILAYGFRYYETRKMYGTDDSVMKVRVWGGDNSVLELTAAEDVMVTIPKGSAEDLKVVSQLGEVIHAPVEKGAKIGTVSILRKDETIYEGNLVVLKSVGEGGFFSGFLDSVTLFFVQLIGGDPLKI